MKPPDAIALVYFTSFSAVTLLAFAFDKWCARRSRLRVAERTLVLLGALGGWPGGLFGMTLFRHKTAKWTFQLKYALALLPFAAEIWLWHRWR